MWSSFSGRLLGLGLGIALAGCGGDLTLPDDGSPPPDDRSPAALLVFSGDGQEARVGRRLSRPLVVRVTDASARGVAGVPVAFGFREAVPDAEVDPTIETTDEDGKASAQVTLGSTAGSHTVEARVAQPSLLATFGVTAVPRGGSGGGDGGGGDDDD
jgi:hypothetical protein